MRRNLPPKEPDRRHSARIADFINAIDPTRTSPGLTHKLARLIILPTHSICARRTL